MLTAMLLTVLVGIVIFLCCKRYQKVRLIEKIPGPSALPLLGNSLDLVWGSHKDLFNTMNNFTKIGNGITRIYVGLQPYCLLSSARTVEAVFASNVILTKSLDYDVFNQWLGTGLVTAPVKKWKTRRKQLTPAFHFKILEDFIDVFNHQAQRFVDKLQANVNKGPFDVYSAATLCTLDVILEAAMGVDINVQNNNDNEYVKAVEGISEAAQTREYSPWLHNDFIFGLTQAGKKHKHCLEIVHSMSLKTISIRRQEYAKQKAEKHEATSGDESAPIGIRKKLAFLDLLLESSDRDDLQFTDEDIREEVDTFMFAGHDTTGSATGFTIYLLGRHPHIQAQVAQEVREVVGTGPVVSRHLGELKLLEACIKESLRLFPPVPYIGRKLLEPTVIDGYEIPAGTTLFLMIHSIHRDPAHFPNPEEFKPERFLGDNFSKRHPYSFVPFSAGPRNCIGQKFAMMEMKVVLANFLRSFEVQATQSIEELDVLGELILRPAHGILATISKRQF